MDRPERIYMDVGLLDLFDREGDGEVEYVRADLVDYLAQPEKKREALSKEEILKRWDVAVRNGHIDRATFIYGVRFAEKHHGITGGGE